MKETTFEDVERKYKEASHYLEVNWNLTFDQADVPDRKVLAGWFYKASKEWLHDFQGTALDYAHSREIAGKILMIDERFKIKAHSDDLVHVIENFRSAINSKFGLELK